MTKNLKVIAVDSGKYATKAVRKDDDGKFKRLTFKTKMDKTDEKFTTLRETYCISIGGNPQSYLIGDGAEGIDYDKTKSKDIHKFAIYTAISQLVNNGDKVALSIGCPITVFNNLKERTDYSDFIKDNGKIEMLINGTPFNFEIATVTVMPESSGIIWKKAEEFEKKAIGIIDIGGLNTNACAYERLNPIKSTSFTNNLGANILRNELKLSLNEKFIDCNLQDWQMEDVIENGFIKSNPTESREFISNFLSNHIQSILNDCKKKGWDLNNMDIIFVGGGSKLLKREIMAKIPSCEISDSAEWDNVEGFYIVCSAMNT